VLAAGAGNTRLELQVVDDYHLPSTMAAGSCDTHYLSAVYLYVTLYVVAFNVTLYVVAFDVHLLSAV
jgi:hypothetical protein